MQTGYNPERTLSLSKGESKGFAPILIVLLIAILGIGGYFVYTNYSNLSQEKSRDNRTKTVVQTQQATPVQTLKPNTAKQSETLEKSQIVFEKDIPSTGKKLIVFNTKNNIEGFDSELYITNNNYNIKSAKKLDIKLVSIASYEVFFSPSKTNPYIVLYSFIGDSQYFYLFDSEGVLISKDLLIDNSKAIGYNTKFKCQCGTSFKAWSDNTHFSLKIVNGNDEEYEILIDAKSGQADEASFKRIK